MSFSFLLQLLAAHPASLCLANNPVVGIYLDRYNPLFFLPANIIVSNNKRKRNVPILLDTLYKWHFSCSSSSHHLVGVCSVQVQPMQPAQLLVEGSSVAWEVNRAKTLPTRTHLARLLPAVGLGSLLRQVNKLNKVVESVLQ